MSRTDHVRVACGCVEAARQQAARETRFTPELLIAEAQVHATLALVEQQRIANRLEYVRLAVEQYGNYAPTGANRPSLFLPPETEQGNMRVPDDIARALRIGDDHA